MNDNRVLIDGYFGAGNAGDEAILESEIALFKERGAEVTVAAADPEAVQNRHSVSAISRITVDEAQWRSKAREVDHIVIGGGGLITSANIFGYCYSVVQACDDHNVPVHFLGVGVTPPVTLRHKLLYRRLLDNAASIVVRDDASKSFLQQIGVTQPVSVKPDFAYYHTRTTPPDSIQDSNRLLLVLNDISWLPVDLDGLVSTAESVYEQCGCEVTVVEFSGQKSDKKYVERFLTRCDVPAKLSSAAELYELENLVADSRYVIGMRLHAVVLAGKHGVPYLSVAYNPKCVNVPAQFGYPNYCWCTDIPSKKLALSISETWYDDQVRSKVVELARKTHQNARSLLDGMSTDGEKTNKGLGVASQFLRGAIYAEKKTRDLLNRKRRPAPHSVVPNNFTYIPPKIE